MKPFAVTSVALFNSDSTLRYGNQKVEFYADDSRTAFCCVSSSSTFHNSLRLRSSRSWRLLEMARHFLYASERTLTPRHQQIKAVWMVGRIDRGAGFLCLLFLSVVWANHQRLHRSQEEIPRGSGTQAVQPQILPPRDSPRDGNGSEHERDPSGDDVLSSVFDGHDLSRLGVGSGHGAHG